MGFTLYVIDAETGEYVHYGKELEVKGEGNHLDTVAMLQFFMDKEEAGHPVIVRRFDIFDEDTKIMKKDVSEEYRKYAKEEAYSDGERSRRDLELHLSALMAENKRLQQEIESFGGHCGDERPVRKTLCQLPKGHSGSHQAVIYWEPTSDCVDEPVAEKE